MAEWSKAPDLSSGTRKCAWVRTPQLTKLVFLKKKNVVLTIKIEKKNSSGYLILFARLQKESFAKDERESEGTKAKAVASQESRRRRRKRRRRGVYYYIEAEVE